MNRFACVAAVCAGMLASGPVLAGIAGATADGTWDCKDMKEAPLGTVVVAGTSYAFIKLNGRVGGYGTLHQVGEAEFDLPHFVVLGGYIKDEVGAVGLAMTGPRGNNHDLSGELFLALVITETDTPYCRRRGAPAS